MSLFRRSRVEERSDAGWYNVLGSSSGMGRSMKSALRLVPLYAGTNLIADSLSIMPASEYEIVNGSKRKAARQSPLLLDPHPVPTMTRVEWIFQYTTSFLMRGNAYGLIVELEPNGTPSKIVWLHPDHVTVDESGPLPVYSYKGQQLDTATLLHIPWYTLPGSVVGLSPIGQFKQVIETGYLAEKYGKDWFDHGSTPSGHLKNTAKTLDGPEASAVKSRFKASVAANDIFVSGNDWEWAALSVKPDEAQFLQTIKATANQIAAIYRLDPADIGGESANSMTYSTLELNQIKFQSRALQPIFTRLEHHISRLLPRDNYLKFNPDAMVRTDIKSRMEALSLQLKAGLLTNDEGRELEDKSVLTPEQKQEWQDNYVKSAAKPTKEE